MLTTKETALAYLNNKIDTVDLLDDTTFLNDVDESIVSLSKEFGAWPDVTIARKRKKLFDKISKLLESKEVEK